MFCLKICEDISQLIRHVSTFTQLQTRVLLNFLPLHNKDSPFLQFPFLWAFMAISSRSPTLATTLGTLIFHQNSPQRPLPHSKILPFYISCAETPTLGTKIYSCPFLFNKSFSNNSLKAPPFILQFTWIRKARWGWSWVPLAGFGVSPLVSLSPGLLGDILSHFCHILFSPKWVTQFSPAYTQRQETA